MLQEGVTYSDINFDKNHKVTEATINKLEK